MKSLTLAIIILTLHFTLTAEAHEGDLDVYGGHYVLDASQTQQLDYHIHQDKRVGHTGELNLFSRGYQKKKDYESAAMVRYLMNDYEGSMRYFRWAMRNDKKRELIIHQKMTAVIAVFKRAK